MEINGINQVGNAYEPKKSKKPENKPALEQKKADASSADVLGSYGKAMLSVGKVSFGNSAPASSSGKPCVEINTDSNTVFIGKRNTHVSTKCPDGVRPYVNGRGVWVINKQETSLPGTGCRPVITIEGNWCINGEDTGYSSKGGPASVPVQGENGNWFIDGEDTGYSSTDPNNIPEISDSKTWVIAGKDTGKPVHAHPGVTPFVNDEGNWVLDGKDTGYSAVEMPETPKPTETTPGEKQPATEKNIPSSYVDPESGHVIIDYPDGTSRDIGILEPYRRSGIKIDSTSIDPKSGHLMVEYSDGAIEDKGEVPGYFPSKSIDAGKQDTVAPAPEEQPEHEVQIASTSSAPESGHVIQEFNDGTSADTETTEETGTEDVRERKQAKINALPDDIKESLKKLKITDENTGIATKIFNNEQLLDNLTFMSHAAEVISAVKTQEQEKAADILIQNKNAVGNKTFMQHAGDLIAITGKEFTAAEFKQMIENDGFINNERSMNLFVALRKSISAQNVNIKGQQLENYVTSVKEKLDHLPEKVAEKFKNVEVNEKNVIFVDSVLSDENILKNDIFTDSAAELANEIDDNRKLSVALLIRYDEDLNANETFMKHAPGVLSVFTDTMGVTALTAMLTVEDFINNEELLQTFTDLNKAKKEDPNEYRIAVTHLQLTLPGLLSKLT